MAKKCIFCEIVKGEEKAYWVYKNQLISIFLDKYPLRKGHCLLIPNKHVELFPELDNEISSKIINYLRVLALAVEQALDQDGSFIAINVKVSQSIPHVHFHVIPRKKGDGLFSYKLIWKRTRYKKSEAEEIAKSIGSKFKSLLSTSNNSFLP